MRRLLLVIAATTVFVLGCEIKRDDKIKTHTEGDGSLEISCRHPLGNTLYYKWIGSLLDETSLPFRSRNSIWFFVGERDSKLFRVASTFCHLEEEIK